MHVHVLLLRLSYLSRVSIQHFHRVMYLEVSNQLEQALSKAEFLFLTKPSSSNVFFFYWVEIPFLRHIITKQDLQNIQNYPTTEIFQCLTKNH